MAPGVLWAFTGIAQVHVVPETTRGVRLPISFRTPVSEQTHISSWSWKRFAAVFRSEVRPEGAIRWTVRNRFGVYAVHCLTRGGIVWYDNGNTLETGDAD